MTFDDALSALLALVGRRVEVHVVSAGESPHLVATFGGVLRAGHSMTGGEPSEHDPSSLVSPFAPIASALHVSTAGWSPDRAGDVCHQQAWSAAWAAAPSTLHAYGECPCESS